MEGGKPAEQLSKDPGMKKQESRNVFRLRTLNHRLKGAAQGSRATPVRRVRQSDRLGAKSVLLFLISRFVIRLPNAHNLSGEPVICSPALISWWRRLVDGRWWLLKWNSITCWRSARDVDTSRAWFYS